MKKWIAAGVWAVLYILCLVLGLAEPANGFGQFLSTLLALAFFVPGWLLLYWGRQDRDRKLLRIIRITALVSLGGTLAALVGNFLSVLGPEALGRVLHWILAVLSVPMLCSGYWVVSLFLWACLLMATFSTGK